MRGDWPVDELMEKYYVGGVTSDARGTVVLLKDQTPENNFEKGLKAWSPTHSASEAEKLFRRLNNTGFLVEKNLGICMALRNALYEKDYGLTYYGKPIIDFGVCAGSARVIREDKLYRRYPGCTPTCLHEDQDPNNHYWLYFLTEDGEHVYYDCGMFIFNLRLGVQTTTYFAPHQRDLPVPAVPGFEIGRLAAIGGGRTQLHTERKPPQKSRFSVAGSPLISDATKDIKRSPSIPGGKSRETLIDIVKAIRAGRKDNAPDDLSNLAISVVYREGMATFEDLIRYKRWKKYPKVPVTAIIDES
ncbi:hypothetical protein BT69DRAFT_214570 [Atractiella rhizophila]|nr:hypothetical protein BT69DRAFT_214570 [Atractiella rhizophila]